jgi:hypothetical protein
MHDHKPQAPVPYNTGKVQIGSRYEPPRKHMISRDAELIQAALLGHKRTMLRRSHILGFVLTISFLFLVAVVLI